MNEIERQEGAEYTELVERKTPILSEIPPIEEVVRSFAGFKLPCPWFGERIDLTICNKCKFFGGFVRIRAIQFRTKYGYRYIAFPMPEELARDGRWKQLPQMRIVHIPSNIVCNFPQRVPLTPEWKDGFEPDANQELEIMKGEVE